MTATVATYAIYLLVAIPLTVWVARTLHKNGRIFLVDCFKGNEELADSVNHLLVVGFYLVNIGFVTLYLKLSSEVLDVRGVFEALSGKLGVVLLVLGAMHFFNVLIFTRLRRRAELDKVLAREIDATRASTDDERTLLENSRFGTVGAVALDASGRLAAATSTGGMTNKRWGRIGDSPLIGAGTFADTRCAISCTGHGEYFIRGVVAYDVAAK